MTSTTTAAFSSLRTAERAADEFRRLLLFLVLVRFAGINPEEALQERTNRKLSVEVPGNSSFGQRTAPSRRPDPGRDGCGNWEQAKNTLLTSSAH
jgi:hypothetical protein